MFTELTANILYLNVCVCVFACVYIGACTVCARSMWLLAEGSELLA